MRRAILILCAVAGLLAAGADFARAGEAPPIVVELFTSQGCSSCPPADAYLGELAQRPNVLALGFHVNYWDYIGWKDPYASRLATDRQRQYQRSLDLPYIFTPQIVVGGVLQGVGSDRGDIEAALRRAAEKPPAHPSLALAHTPDGGFVAHVGDGAAARPATLWLVCYDRRHSTAVSSGENSGRTLVNYNVVRRWESLGTWKGAALDLPVPHRLVEGYSGNADAGIAIVLQEGETGPILAAQVAAPAP